MKKATVISVINNKGGVGKTTTTVSLGAALQRAGHKVLLVDLDGQANLSLVFGQDPNTSHNIGRVLLGHLEVDKVLVKTKTIDLLPGSSEHDVIEKQLTSETSTETKLRKHIKKSGLKDQYDYILIDCPPSKGNFTANALVASDYYLVPVEPDFFGYSGIRALLSFVHKLEDDDLNDDLKLLGVMLNKYNPKQKNNTKKAFAEKIKENKIHVFETYIRQDKNLIDSVTNGCTIFDQKEDSNAAIDYTNLAKEVIAITKNS